MPIRLDSGVSWQYHLLMAKMGRVPVTSPAHHVPACSTARLHVGRRKTYPLNTDHRVVEMEGDSFLREGMADEDVGLERHVSSGRPWAGAAFVEQLERLLGRALTRSKGGWPEGVPRRKGRSRCRISA